MEAINEMTKSEQIEFFLYNDLNIVKATTKEEVNSLLKDYIEAVITPIDDRKNKKLAKKLSRKFFKVYEHYQSGTNKASIPVKYVPTENEIESNKYKILSSNYRVIEVADEERNEVLNIYYTTVAKTKIPTSPKKALITKAKIINNIIHPDIDYKDLSALTKDIYKTGVNRLEEGLKKFLNQYTIRANDPLSQLKRSFIEMDEICDEIDDLYFQALKEVVLPENENEALMIKAKIYNRITKSEIEFEDQPIEFQKIIIEEILSYDKKIAEGKDSKRKLERIHEMMIEGKTFN